MSGEKSGIFLNYGAGQGDWDELDEQMERKHRLLLFLVELCLSEILSTEIMEWTSMTASGSYSWIYFNKCKRIKDGRVVFTGRGVAERWESVEASIRGKGL